MHPPTPPPPSKEERQALSATRRGLQVAGVAGVGAWVLASCIRRLLNRNKTPPTRGAVRADLEPAAASSNSVQAPRSPQQTSESRGLPASFLNSRTESTSPSQGAIESVASTINSMMDMDRKESRPLFKAISRAVSSSGATGAPCTPSAAGALPDSE